MILGISFPLKTQALTQYAHLNPTGVTMLNGKVVLTTDDGVHVLDNEQDDNGVNISAWFKTIRTDFGFHNRKKIRSVYLRALAQALEVSLITEDTTRAFDYESSDGSLRQEEGYVQGRRDQVGAYWQLKIANKDGEDFSLDSIDMLVVPTSFKIDRRPVTFRSTL